MIYLIISLFIYGGLLDWQKAMTFNKVGRLLAQFYAGTRKSLKDFWLPLLELPIKFGLSARPLHFAG